RDAVRGAAPRRDGRPEHALHPAGRRRGDMEDHAAAARRSARRPRVRAGNLGTHRCRRDRRRPRPLEHPLGGTMTSARNDYDVIIIGTGAGGGTLARHVAPSGKRILLLERGDWLPREPHNWSAQDVFVDGRYVSPDTWHDAR